MATTMSFSITGSAVPIHVPERNEPPIVLQRVRDVRRLQGMSLRSAARHLKTDVRTAREMEEPTADLHLSDLYKWQSALQVPVTELLVEANDPLSAPIQERAQLVKIMKTAQAMLEKAPTLPIKRMASMLIEQLCELMPELKDVGPWPAVGQRRGHDEVGRIAEKVIPSRDTGYRDDD